MRRLAWLIAAVACSPAPPERLQTPKPLPGRCKTPGEIAQLAAPILATNKARDAAAIAKFTADRGLTIDSNALPMMIANQPRWVGGASGPLPDAESVERAIEESHHRGRDLVRIDLGRAMWSQVIVARAGDGERCAPDPLPPTSWMLAHDATGESVAIRTRYGRHVVSSVEQCGTCSVGCGIPVNDSEWMAVLLPIAAGVPYRIESLDLPQDRVQIWCEHETPAM